MTTRRPLGIVALVLLSACSGSSTGKENDDGGMAGAPGADGSATSSVGGTGGSTSTSGRGLAGSTGTRPDAGVGGIGGPDASPKDSLLDTSRDSSTTADTARAPDAAVRLDGAGDAPLTQDLASPDSCRGDACGTTATRPTYNTGTGFFVKGNRLYDASGVEFRIRGVNKCHYDADWPGIPKTHANTIRWGVPLWLGGEVSAKLMRDSIAQKIVPMAGIWYTSGTWADADNVTCKEDTAILNRAVDQWVAQAATFKPFEKNLLVNIANEWGPDGSTVWRDAYISAVARMRAAGYLGTLVVDAGGCGQDPTSITKYAQAILDSDPQRNILFDVHIYGLWSNGVGESWQTDLTKGLDSLAATGLAIVLGEFGPGRNIGASPTNITPGTIITEAEARGMGWMAWAWDDPASDAKDTDFALSKNGEYKSSADLTTFGKDVVENPSYGLLHLGQPATTF